MPNVYRSFLEAANALARFDKLYRKTILAEVDRATAAAVKLSITRYMVGGGKSAPANPPPGPLRIRSGDLRRTVRQVKATYRGGIYRGGITAGRGLGAYPHVHEKGGRKSYFIRPRVKKFLSWVGTDGKRHFAKLVRRRPLKARPYLAPALVDVAPGLQRNVDRALTDLALRVV